MANLLPTIRDKTPALLPVYETSRTFEIAFVGDDATFPIGFSLGEDHGVSDRRPG